MSTKCTIRSFLDEESGGGYHLFTDCFDSFMDDDDNQPVYLELNGVEFTASSPGRVEVKIPRDWAIKLGLVPAKTK